MRLEAGSVGLTGQQTGFYTEARPGGWHIIGNTQMAMFDPTRATPALLAPGHTVRFERVT